MTKTKRFYALILFAFALVFLAACGEPELLKPSSLEIECAEEALSETALKLTGDDLGLAVKAQEGYDMSVEWSSSDEAIATVDSEGYVTAAGIGKATITATSKVAPEVSASYDVVVYGASPADMLAAAAEYVKDAMPEYIRGGYENDKQVKTKLPSDYLKDYFTYSYSNVADPSIVYSNARYYTTDEWNEAGVDSLDTIKCTIAFKSGLEYSGSREAIIQIHVVNDLEENDFKAVDIYTSDFDTFFNEIDVNNYATPEQVLNVRQSDLLTVTWSTTDSSVLSIALDEAGEHYVLKYTKPLDDTSVTLTAIVVTDSGTGATKSIDILCKGFSKQDKIDYFKNTVCANLVALAGVRVNNDIKIPTNDPQFEMEIAWASSNEDYLTAAGVYTDHKEDPVDTPTKVTLTATITYYGAGEFGLGTAESPFNDPASFIEDVAFIIDVYPCTEVARALNMVTACNAKLGDQEADGSYLGYFPYGRLTRENDKLNVPATFEACGYTGDVDHPEWKSAAVTWTCSEEGLFDSEWNLLKQYLRYHPVSMTGTVTLGDTTESFVIDLNVGLAKYEGTIHAGGSFSRLAVQTSELTAIAMDSLSTLSGFDESVGKYQDYYKGDKTAEWYTQVMKAKDDLSGSEYIVPDYDAYKIKPVTVDKAFALGFTSGFGGVTLSWINPETGMPYVWYACEAFTWVLTDDDINDDGTIKTKWIKYVQEGVNKTEVECSEEEATYRIIKSIGGRNNKQYDGMVVVNASSKVVKFPILYHEGESNDLYPLNKQGRIGESGGFEAGACLGVYGGDPCSVILNGKVGLYESEDPALDQTRFNISLPCLQDGITDEVTGAEEILKTIYLAPGAVLMDCCEGQDYSYTDKGGTSGGGDAKDVSLTGLCTAGVDVQVDFWKIHACNTVSCTDRWSGEVGANINLWANVIANSSSIDIAVAEARK